MPLDRRVFVDLRLAFLLLLPMPEYIAVDCPPCGESTAMNAAESAAMGHATLAYHAQNMSIVIVPVWVSDLVVERASEESK
jgi:hypothetical protein